LLADHRRRYPEPSASASGSNRVPARLALVGRLALASAALTVAGVAACQIPVDVELELGRRVVFEVPAGPDAHDQIERVMQEFERRSNAESIELRVRHTGGETMQATLDVWGSTLDLAAVDAVLDEHGFTPDDVEDLALAGTIQTTWGDRLGHELFNLELELDHLDVDQARQAILDQLEAHGFDGDAEVEVEVGDGIRRVEIRLDVDDHRHTRESAP
jgi:hypothetical protein